MLDSIIVVDNVLVVQNNKVILPNISFDLKVGQSLAVVGDHHNAKAKLLECLIGKSPFRGSLSLDDAYQSIVYVPSQHVFTNRSNINSFYYQQRYNSHDANDSYTIREVLVGPKKEIDKTVVFLGLEEYFDKPLLQLSNGENKKVQLAQALIKKPKILLLDHPFSGLDVSMRQSISDILLRLKDEGVIIIISTDQATIPSAVSHILVIECNKDPKFGEISKFDFTKRREVVKRNYGPLHKKSVPSLKTIIEFKNVNITYNGQKILDNVNWKVGAGDRWLIKGPNGSGKSTLLSLINGDNPQAFANDITLFDRKKGSGESIWDIKKHIGYFSPELYLHFDKSQSVYQAVIGGLQDTIQTRIKIDEKEELRIQSCFEIFGLAGLQKNKLFAISDQERRLVHLLRAFIKDPALLILDEPYQGLNHTSVKHMNQIIESWIKLGNRTLLFVSHYDDKLPNCFNNVLELG